MKTNNEFAILVEKLALRGYPRIKLLSEIHDLVLYDYKRRYPGGAQNASVVIHEETGDIRILSGHDDVTPPEFIPIAEKIAKDYLSEKLQSLDHVKKFE